MLSPSGDQTGASLGRLSVVNFCSPDPDPVAIQISFSRRQTTFTSAKASLAIPIARSKVKTLRRTFLVTPPCLCVIKTVRCGSRVFFLAIFPFLQHYLL